MRNLTNHIPAADALFAFIPLLDEEFDDSDDVVEAASFIDEDDIFTDYL